MRVASVAGTTPEVQGALEALRAAVPALGADAVLGPVRVDPPDAAGGENSARVGGRTGSARAAGGDDEARAFVRFDYALGTAVTASLRASVVAAALRTRRPAKGRPPGPRNTLKVRVDVPDLDL